MNQDPPDASIYTVDGIRCRLDDDLETIRRLVARQIGVTGDPFSRLDVIRESLDARKKSRIMRVVKVEFTLPRGIIPAYKPNPVNRSHFDDSRPATLSVNPRESHKGKHAIIVGTGPAGLFCAMALAEAGLSVTLLERGKPVETRMNDIRKLRSRGELNPESNLCFGEGGAGTYSDGKLYTRVKHPFAHHVLHTFVRFGADPGILVDAHPHIGTDRLVPILRNLRAHLESQGAQFRFQTRVEGIARIGDRAIGVETACGEMIEGSHIILAVGHSARELFDTLVSTHVASEPKAFAVGVRVEHPQALIDQAQYGKSAGHPRLGPATYRLNTQVAVPHKPSRGVYSFCMCPGGVIVPSPTEPEHMAINGMSHSTRGSGFANAGLVAEVGLEDLAGEGFGSDSLAGLRFQRAMEQAVFSSTSSPYAAPGMRLTDFIQKKQSTDLAPTRFKPRVEPADLWSILPHWLLEPIAAAIQIFDRKIRGFHSSEANVMAIESRTSSPIRFLRDHTFQSPHIRRLYLAGEGAGYAGGIVSSAVDGLRIAESILSDL